MIITVFIIWLNKCSVVYFLFNKNYGVINLNPKMKEEDMSRWVKAIATFVVASFAFAGVAAAQEMRFFKIGTGGTGGTKRTAGQPTGPSRCVETHERADVGTERSRPRKRSTRVETTSRRSEKGQG